MAINPSTHVHRQTFEVRIKRRDRHIICHGVRGKQTIHKVSPAARVPLQCIDVQRRLFDLDAGVNANSDPAAANDTVLPRIHLAQRSRPVIATRIEP